MASEEDFFQPAGRPVQDDEPSTDEIEEEIRERASETSTGGHGLGGAAGTSSGRSGGRPQGSGLSSSDAGPDESDDSSGGSDPGDASPPGAGDEATAGVDDADAGDDSRTVLRSDARSDPFEEQTTVVAARRGSALDEQARGRRSPAAGSQSAIEARRRLRRARVERAGYGGYSGPLSAVAAGENVSESFENVSGSEQGLEESGATDEFFQIEDPDAGPNASTTLRRSEQEIAQLVETQFLDENPEFAEEDVRVVADESGGLSFAIEFTAEGEQQRRLMGEAEAREAIAADFEEQVGEDVEPSDVILSPVPGGGFEGGLRSDTLDRLNQPAAQDRDAVEGRLETQLERRIGRALGGSFAARMAHPDAEATGERGPRDVDLQRGPDEDFTIELTDGGLAAIPTASFQEEQTIQQAEAIFEFQTGVDLDPETDIVVGEEGRATLSEEAEERALGNEFSEAFDLPVPWFIAPDAEPGPIPGFRRTDVASETREATATVDTAFTDLAERGALLLPGVTEARTLAAAEEAAQLPPDERPSLVEFGQRVLEEPAEETPTERQVEAAVGGGAADLVSIPLSIPSQIEQVGEVSAEAINVQREEGPGQIGSLSRGVEGDPLFESGEGALGFVTEETIETGEQVVEGVEQQVSSPTGRARLAGSLVGSAIVMGGAAAISPRAGLASRVAIQPGEEILGYGGYGVTRRVAGQRAADRFFPNQEPLIFSEEAAIRGLRRGGELTVRGARRARSRGADIVLGEPETTIRASPTGGWWDPTIESERPGVRERTQEVGTRIRDVFGGTDRGQLQMPAGRLRGEGTDPEIDDDPVTILSGEDIPPDPFGPIEQDPLVWDEPLGPSIHYGRRRGGSGPDILREASRPSVEAETARELGRRRESALVSDPLAMQDLGFEQFAVEDAIAETGIGLEVDLGEEVATEARTDVELMSETGLISETAVASDLEFEFELETEFEFEFETEGEIESEVEVDDTRRRRAPDPFDDEPLPGWMRRLDRDLINPITGG